VDSNSEIQGYNVYPMLHFCRKFSSGVTTKQRKELIEDLLVLKDVVPMEESCPLEEEDFA